MRFGSGVVEKSPISIPLDFSIGVIFVNLPLFGNLSKTGQDFRISDTRNFDDTAGACAVRAPVSPTEYFLDSSRKNVAGSNTISKIAPNSYKWWPL